MSLQIWMPLTGNLDNYGLSSVNCSTSATSVYENGKIGKCLSVSSSSYLTIPYNGGSQSSFTFSFWMKIPTAMKSNTDWEVMMQFNCLDQTGGSVNVCSIQWASYQNVKIYSNSYHQLKWRTPTYDTWEHWAITHEPYNTTGVTIKIYVNGDLIGTYNKTDPLILQDGNIYFGNGVSAGQFYINDFRLYDHCLSPKEVKEISKGLVLHYKLADAGTTEYDCSGYGHNGTKTSTITTGTGSPRYNNCNVFNGSDTYITAGTGAKVTDEISVCWWGNMSDWANYTRATSCTEGGGWNFEPNSSSMSWVIGTGSSSNTYYRVNYAFSNLTSGWHYFVGTYDGLSLRLYVDGALKISSTPYTTKTPIYYYANNGIFVGCEAGSNTTTPAGNYFNGSLSDFRIYATALSAEDVAQLYHTPAAADNLGNFYGCELVESDDLNVQKTGVVNGSVFQEEDGKTKIGNDGTIYANIFYEF